MRIASLIPHVYLSLVLAQYSIRSGTAFSLGPATVPGLGVNSPILRLSPLLNKGPPILRQTPPLHDGSRRRFHGSVVVLDTAAKDDYQLLDGEKRINLKVDLENTKVVTNQEVSAGEKKVYCRCWLSGQFPLCDGAHLKHNAATQDNVGPLVLSVPKQTVSSSKSSKTKSLSPVELGRQRRVVWGYRITTIGYLLHVLQSFLTTGLPISVGSIQSSSGYLLAAGLAYILASAAQANRLSSDTYKRLNLSLMQCGIIMSSGLVVNGSRAIPNVSLKVLAIPSLLAMIHGIKGYGYGVLGLDKSAKTSLLVQDFGQGVMSTVQGMLSMPKNIKAATYSVAIYLMTGIKFATLTELVQLVSRGTDAWTIVPHVATYARYAMLWTVLYTLKDAADRGRLDGTTFIELNLLSAGVLAIMSAAAGITSPVGGVAFLVGLFSVLTGISSIRSKKRS